ncbi:hypothetical protein WQ54_23210 [Bacillus sp. SA1-12]|uniref:FtsX-like permease family protein n=1 Tax=Bacillus sp. SA1-12 TaxID=1455638 RepID=UPI000627369A|nr:ABC transporter permease [Bacillus sp. SA1-12]KKI90034.1 hypothetical protein WQ54_23210 [Bacillus sp. SA1-12]
MLIKLAMNGMKGRLKDYIVLFAGSIIPISVFYMFLTLAVNQTFIRNHSLINHIQLVFIVGTVLLSVISFIYILYTTSFLLSLRKKEFGIYQLIGVKKEQIKKVILTETMAIGGFSIIQGIAFGVFLSLCIAMLLAKQLNITLAGFKPFYLPAVLFTILFFLFIYFISVLLNNRKLTQSPIIKLLYSEIQSDHSPAKHKGTMIKIILGTASLFIGYTALILMEFITYAGLFLAPIMTTLGTYLLFDSIVPLVVQRLKENKHKRLKGINSFTYSQLSFRINELKRVLATIAMFIALSAGAISGGFAFKNNVLPTVDKEVIYDMTLYNPDALESTVIHSIPFTEKHHYRFKFDEEFNYYLYEDLVKNPPLIEDFITYQIRRAGNLPLPEKLPIENSFQILPEDWYMALETINPAMFSMRSNKIVSIEDYKNIPQKEVIVVLGKTENFQDYLAQWKELDQLQLAKYFDLLGYKPDADSISSKYSSFLNEYAFASGTYFMGFFLGFAFLTMMASVLMFKILSGASMDIHRYAILRKIGVRNRLLAASISKELFIVFLFPALLGILHVVVGMRMFSFIMLDPYYKIWISILLFIAIYTVYYFSTVYMYKKIVLPKNRARVIEYTA